ncbi:MAG: histidinol-phosphate transaminase [Candidatus Saccharicenans sp.]|nr:histidinol-phosphate transaminase [Candidatus Saccharicenans sp.]
MRPREYDPIKTQPRLNLFRQNTIIRLNLNESSLDLPVSLKNKVWCRLRNLNWNRYPDEENQELLFALADYCHQPPENILPGNGSNELIATLFNSISPEGMVIIFRPSFSIYSRQLRAMRKNFMEIRIDIKKGYVPGAWLEKIPSAELVILDSPNNPIGCIISSDLLKEILHRARGLVVVDEAYAEFSELSYTSWVRQFENLAVIKTLSKAFRLAGARFGFLVSMKPNIDRLKKVHLPFSVGIFQQTAALVAIQERKIILQQVEKIKKERERIFSVLNNLSNFKPLPSRANFLLVQTKTLRAKDVYLKLKAMGILVRIFDTPELENYFRVTIGSRRENDIFLQAIKFLEQEQKYEKRS